MRKLLRLFYTMCLNEAKAGINANAMESTFTIRFLRYKVYTLRKK